jgi:hypothetical protein
LTAHLLNFLARNPSKSVAAIPTHGFALTGDDFIYATQNGVQQNIDLTDPGVDSELTVVFGNSVNHLVLLVNANEQ